HQPVPHIDTVIKAVAADPSGQVWIASDQGMYATDGGEWWHPFNRADGMPYETMTCIAIAPNGDVWGGTTEGAWRLRHGEDRYFWGPRWLPGNNVTSIAVDNSNSAYIATNGGIARIDERPITLAEKANHYEEI